MKNYIIILVSSLLLASCSFGIAGNGDVQEETRALKPYTKIVASGAYEIILSQKEEHNARVKADANLLPYIETRVEGNTLYLKTTETIRKAETLQIYLSAKELEEIELSGAVEFTTLGTLTAQDLDFDCSGAVEVNMAVKVEDLDCTFSGASQVDLSGTATNVQVSASGASELNWYELEIEDLEIEASGACDAEVFVTRTLSAQLSGASELKYKGQPKIEKSNISGASELKAAK
jgi:hypothetical protein